MLTGRKSEMLSGRMSWFKGLEETHETAVQDISEDENVPNHNNEEVF